VSVEHGPGDVEVLLQGFDHLGAVVPAIG